MIDAKIEADHLRRELAEAEDRLATIEARGDSVQRLKHALNAAETQIESLRSTAESEGIMRLASDHYGWSIPWNKISSEMKHDFRNHASVIAFKKFVVHASQNVSDPTELRQRLQIVRGKRLRRVKLKSAHSKHPTNESLTASRQAVGSSVQEYLPAVFRSFVFLSLEPRSFGYRLD